MFLLTTLRRALAANPHTVPVTAHENSALAARGIQQPTLRSYLAWRRSSMIVVVIATLVSAGLTTYREFFETGERLDVLQTMAEHLQLEDKHIHINLQDENERDTAAGSEAEAEEPTDEEAAAEETPSAFGRFTEWVELIALNILPAAALAVVLLWKRFQASFQILVAAFAFAFLVPLVIGLCPWSWWGYVEPNVDPKTHPIEFFKVQAEGLWEGILYLVALLPTVISLVPGVQRACIRVKLLLPQSTLPGWFLVMASPFYALCLLVVFVAINQFQSHPLFFSGMLLFLLAPLCYAVRASVFTQPLATADDYHQIRLVKGVVGAMTVLAAALVISYLTTREVLGVHLLGLNYKSSLLVPLDVVEFLLETISRSMFITVLGADLFMRMNLSAWKSSRNFNTTAEAAKYDQVMTELDGLR